MHFKASMYFKRMLFKEHNTLGEEMLDEENPAAYLRKSPKTTPSRQRYREQVRRPKNGLKTPSHVVPSSIKYQRALNGVTHSIAFSAR